ncbi:hypothetical protein SJ612_14740 [Enterococcus faecium]
MGNPSLNHRYRKGFYSLFKTLQQNPWAYRNRPVKVLPCDFLYCLSLASGLSMDKVYQDLLLLEEKFLQSLDPKKEKKSI